MAQKTRLSAKERDGFRELLLARRDEILGDVDHLENDGLGRSGRSQSGELSTVPTHMADVAGENYDQEVTYGLIQNEREELNHIHAALLRLEDGVFGLCEDCDKPIPKTRLKALPYARLCIQCKQVQEQGQAAR